MKPRILFLDHVGVLGGAELSLLEVATHYRDTSRVVLFQEGPFVERLQSRGVAVQVVPAPAAFIGISRSGGWWQGVKAIGAVWGLVRQVAHEAAGFDVLYANSQKSFVVGAGVARQTGIPLLWHLRDILDGRHFSRARRGLVVGLANRYANKVIANSRATATAFVNAGGDERRVAVVYNGISAAPFKPGRSPAEARRVRGLPDRPTVGVFSRLAPWKGQHVLVEALLHLSPEVQILFVGAPLFGEEARYASGLEAQVQDLGLQDRVHFLGFRADVPGLLAACDVVAHTSVAPEPFGRVVVEAMLARRPIVATNGGGVVEIIDDKVTGRLVPPGDAPSLATALDDLLNHDTTEMTTSAWQAAVDRFDPERLLRDLEAQVQAVCDGERKGWNRTAG